MLLFVGEVTPFSRWYRQSEEGLSANSDDFHSALSVHLQGRSGLELDVGGVARVATLEAYASRAASPLVERLSDALHFSYVVQAGDVDEDGMGISANRLTVQGGSVRDHAGNRP